MLVCWLPLYITRKLHVWYDPEAADKIRVAESMRQRTEEENLLLRNKDDNYQLDRPIPELIEEAQESRV